MVCISRFGARYDSISMVLSNIEAAMNSPTHREFACALIIDTFGRFLLQQRDDIPSIIQAGKIGMFGGHREARESFLECVAREIREEISYAVPEHRFEYLATYNDADIDVGAGTLHGQFFILRDIPVDELVVTEGSLRIVTPDEISSLTNSLTPIAKMVLKAALEREREFGAELENHATNLVFDQMEKQRKKRPKRLDE
jgi:8-oxo-dGTP pyrophosphatase MutT (NUDIX family)